MYNAYIRVLYSYYFDSITSLFILKIKKIMKMYEMKLNY